MTVGRLRNVGTNYPARSPVRLVTADGREFEFVGWHRECPAADEQGKPTGGMTLVLEIQEVMKPQT